MSARGWADTLTRAAQVADRDARDFERIRPRCPDAVERARTDAAALRELAALLDKITPEMVKHVESYMPTGDCICGSEDCAEENRLNIEALNTLRSLSRGPAEQQETGR